MGIPRTSLLAALALTVTSGAFGAFPRDTRGPATGGISGVAATKEAVPRPIRVTIDPNVCGQSLPDESIVVDAAGHLANVIVTVTGVKGGAPAETLVTNDKCAF